MLKLTDKNVAAIPLTTKGQTIARAKLNGSA